MINNWTVIYCDHNNQFIHLDHIKKSNPNAQILLADISDDYNYNKGDCWRNWDFLLREWLRDHICEIDNNNVAVLEWDVLITKELPNITITGLIGKHKKTLPRDQKWQWFSEKSQLDDYEPYAVGLAPLGIHFINKSSIEILLNNKFDQIYKKNIFCEIRLPTVLNSQNISITEYDMPYVWHVPINCEIGIDFYHPIKYIYKKD